MLDRIEIRLWRIETVGFAIPTKNVNFGQNPKNSKNWGFLTISGFLGVLDPPSDPPFFDPGTDRTGLGPKMVV